MKAAPVEIVDSATAGASPVRPRKALNLLMWLTAGLPFGLGLAQLRRSMHPTIQAADEAEEQLDLPVVAVIPKKA